MLEHDGALRVLQVLVEAHPVAALSQDAGQSCLAHLDRLSAQVVTLKARSMGRGIGGLGSNVGPLALFQNTITAT